MTKTPIDNLDLSLYYEKLDNGLEVYIVPKENSNNIYTTLTTKYGGIHNEFIPINETEMIKVPNGIAHFLEHKMFEQENGKDPFTIFSENGASANAMTDSLKTTYLFSGPDKFEENIDLLLNFVYSPYFTDENVLKEKGIITQEIKMGDDHYFRVGYKKVLNNAFINHPIKIPVIGSIESIESITKEDLYNCYNTFYNPSNMFMVVTGNIDPLSTIELIKNNMKENNVFSTPIIKQYDEPNNIYKKEETIKMNVTIPKLFLGIKINIENIDISYKNIINYLSIYFDSIFGATSELNLKLREQDIINDSIEFMFFPTDKHLLVLFLGESKKIDLLKKSIIENVNNKIDEATFLRKKKVYLSSIISASDNIFSINNKIISDIIYNGYFDTNYYNEIKKLNFKELEELQSKINYDNKTVVIIKPEQ